MRIYCSPKCQRIRNKRVARALNPGPVQRCTSDTGALSELLVCADLMKRGFEVFRAVSPAATCDMVVLSGKSTLRIQVKTANRLPRGGISYPAPKYANQHDHVAAVLISENSITYIPELPILGNVDVPADPSGAV